MLSQILEPRTVTVEHLAANEVAAYVDGALTGERRARVEAHLARCADCRDEVTEAARIIRSLPQTRRRARWLVTSVAAAAAVLIISFLPGLHRNPEPSVHRGPTTAPSPAITLFRPVGTVDSLQQFVWSSVDRADRYHVRVFDPNGSVIWERATADTTVSGKDAALAPGRPFYWQVEADVGFDRHVRSELVQFAVSHSRQ